MSEISKGRVGGGGGGGGVTRYKNRGGDTSYKSKGGRHALQKQGGGGARYKSRGRGGGVLATKVGRGHDYSFSCLDKRHYYHRPRDQGEGSSP